MKKLLFFDIDGTLVDFGNSTMSPSTADALINAKQNGHMIFLCTGRSYNQIYPSLKAFDFDGGLDNANFAYVFEHTDTVPLDQLIAFALVADSLSEGAHDELRTRFLEAPNTVLAYLVLMGDQKVEFGEQLPAAEVICGLIASADAGWYDGSEEFAQTMETCRKNYPTGPAAHLLNVMETEHQTYLEQKQG